MEAEGYEVLGIVKFKGSMGGQTNTSILPISKWSND